MTDLSHLTPGTAAPIATTAVHATGTATSSGTAAVPAANPGPIPATSAQTAVTAAPAPAPPTIAQAFSLLSDAATALAAAFTAHATGFASATGPPPPPFMRATGPWVAGALFSVVPAAALTAIVEDPDSEQRWYAITKGKYVGITTNSILSTGAISGVSGAQHVSYSTQAEALGTFNFALSNHLVNVRH